MLPFTELLQFVVPFPMTRLVIVSQRTELSGIVASITDYRLGHGHAYLHDRF